MIKQSQVETLEQLKRSAVRWISSHGLGLPESEDVFQQAILKAIASPTELEEPGKVTSWFYQILRNTLIDEFRKSKSHAKKITEFSAEILPHLDPETADTLCRCVGALLAELPDAERAILEGHFFSGKKFRELAAEFGLSEGAIRIKALRAREKLKASVRERCDLTRFNEAEDCGCPPTEMTKPR